MILVSDLFTVTQRVLGTSDLPITYDYINRAVRLLYNKACSSNVTWDPALIYCNIKTDSTGYGVTLPYQIEKPIAVNLNSSPSFTRGQLFEFTMNGPGSTDPLVGFQWMDQGTKPLQSPLPNYGSDFSGGNNLLFTSDNPTDASEYGNPVGAVEVAFETPSISAMVPVTFTTGTDIAAGQTVYISGVGTFTVASITSAQPTAILTNLSAALGGAVGEGTLVYPTAGTVIFQCLCLMLDNSERTIPVTLGIPSIPIIDLLAVNKPLTLGNISLSVGGYTYAVYPPTVTNPQFFQLKISQPGASVRILGRRRYIAVANTTDFIPLSSIEAVIQMIKAVKFYDEDQYTAAQQCEQTAMTWLNEDNTAKMLYSAAANATQVPPMLNLNIYNRDSLIAGDLWEDACNSFGNIGQQFIFDKITMIIETLQNMSQWDPQIGYVDIQSFGGPDGNQFYVTLPRYVEEVLKMNVNGKPTKFENKWFQFHMNGLQQDNFDGKLPVLAGTAALGLWSNRPWNQIEDMGEVIFAFDPLPVNTPYNVVAIARNPSDAGSTLRMYAYDTQQLPIYDSDGSEGFLVPVGTAGSVFPPNPAGSNMVNSTRVFRDPTSGFIDLWSCDQYGNLIQFLSTYWPDETEPKYRRMRLSTRPITSFVTGTPFYPVMRIMYRKRWRKITSFTDPIHLRSRKAIVVAMDAYSLALNNQAVMAPGQGAKMERDALEVAVKYLNDEWRSLHQNEGLDIQVDEDLWPGVMSNYEVMM